MTTKIRDIYEKVRSKLKLRHVSSEENRGARIMVSVVPDNFAEGLISEEIAIWRRG